eukprot:TRINITY_DN4878_c0_g1_i1.p1 TRINITY_DN4878_c0_g1~~TRINITY_DN4878_c0_g1_i1.p1  ORF type:complete len:267 (+),score=38.29 TRINITY_DN4878_c0_g1_i1:95-895(+)
MKLSFWLLMIMMVICTSHVTPSITGDADLWQVSVNMRCNSNTGNCSRYMNFPYISLGSRLLTVQHATLELRTMPINNNWRMSVSLVCSLGGEASSTELCSSINSSTPKCRIAIPLSKECPLSISNPVWSLELYADEGTLTDTELMVDGSIWACKSIKCLDPEAYESWKRPVIYTGIVLGSLLLVIAIGRRVWLNASTGGSVSPAVEEPERASLSMMLTSWRASLRNTFNGTWRTTRSSMNSNPYPNERSSIVRSPVSKSQALTSVM